MPRQATRILPRQPAAPPSATQTPTPTPPGSPRNNTNPSQKRKGRAGIPNYTTPDTEALLDIVASIHPVSPAHWAQVASRFASWAVANHRPQRDPDSLKGKFGKLVAANAAAGLAGTPLCKRAGALGRQIAAGVRGGEEGGGGEETTEEGSARKRRRATAGASGNGATEGAAKVSGRKMEIELLGVVAEMAGRTGTIVETLRQEVEDGVRLSREEVVGIVREELRPTHELLMEVKAGVEVLVARGRGSGG